MAVPNERLSTVVHEAAFLSPDDLVSTLFVDYELGGVGLNDASEGQRYQIWTCQYDSNTSQFSVSAPNTASTVIHTAAGVTDISFTFDNNMQPFIAYTQAGIAKYYWWDTNTASFVVTTLPTGSVTPRCCLDDKRETQTTANDIILSYVVNGALKMRQQRDRYSVDYLLIDPLVDEFGNPATLKRIGMNTENRLQWLCQVGAA